MLSGMREGKDLSLIDVFEGVGKVAAGNMSEDSLKDWSAAPCPVAELSGALYRKYDGLYDRDYGDVPDWLCRNSCR